MHTRTAITEWVRANLPGWPPGTRLPSDRALAAEFAVSVMTVRRALTACAREGLLVRVKGSGTFVPPLSTPHGDTLRRQHSWEQLTERLEAACREGELRRGDELPAHKELQRLFRVGPTTVSRACRELARRGWITRTGKRYVVGGSSRLPRLPPRSEVLLLAVSEEEAERLFTSDYMALTLQKMESELLSCGYILRFGVYDSTGGLPASLDMHDPRLHGIILTGDDSGRMTGGHFERLLPKLRLPRRGGPRVLVLTTNAHRRIAGVRFFSTSHTTTVMCRELARFIAAGPWQHVEVVYDIAGSGETHMMDVFRLFPELDRFCPRARLHYRIAASSDTPRHNRVLREASSLLSSKHLLARLSKYRTVSPEELGGMVDVYGTLDDAVGAVHDGGVAVCHAATTALAVRHICLARGIAVPGGLSIVSLQNTPACLHREITACIRDWEANGYMMAHALIGDFRVALTRRGFIAAKGRVMQRGST